MEFIRRNRGPKMEAHTGDGAISEFAGPEDFVPTDSFLLAWGSL